MNILDLLYEKVIPELKIIDLDRISPTNVRDYHPKMLMALCLGYLKLGLLDDNLKQEIVKKKHLTSVVEEWLMKDTPIENESSRVLVKFLSKLEIPN